MNKSTLFDQIREHLKAELSAMQRIARDTAAAANHPEARPENDKDTRKVELSYLAAGQAARAAELETALALLGNVPAAPFAPGTRVRAGALVTLEVDGKVQRLLISPAGGGLKLADDSGEIGVVTPQSPLGYALLDKDVGDAFELSVAGKTREIEILEIC